MDKILTIGIPTYNRPEYIQKTVRSILPQLNDKVLLVVRDNCSQIPVESLFTNNELKLFKIVRTKVNIGGNANIAGVIYNCDTPWCWTLGDDDDVAPNAVNTILNYIERYPSTSFIKFNSPLEKEVNGFDDLVQLIKHKYVYSRLLFMSTSIYNVEKVKNYLYYYYESLSTQSGQVVFFLKYMEYNNGNAFFTKTSIIPHSNPPEWNFENYIRPCPVYFNMFKEQRKKLNNNLFVGLTFGYFYNILFGKMKPKLKWDLFWYVAWNYGYYNTFRYHGKLIIQFLVYVLLPDRIYLYLKDKLKTHE